MASGSNPVSQSGGARVLLAASAEWVRLSFTFTAIQPFAQIIATPVADPRNTVTAWDAGDWIDGTGVLVEKSSVLGSYFDHTFSPDPDLTPRALGVPGASASVLEGKRVAELAVFEFAPAVASPLGLKQYGTSKGSNYSRYSAIPLYSIPFVPGREYTALARVTYPAKLTGRDGLSGTLQLRGSGGSTLGQSDAPPNEAGVYDVRAFMVADAASNELRLNHRADGGIIYWDRLAIVEGHYTGPHLDGDDPRVIWEGTPHAATSAGIPPGV